MKVNVIKTIIALCISALFGIICYDIASETDYRHIISLATTLMTDFMCFLFALGIDYSHGHRNVNIKVSAWMFLLIVVIANIVFSFFLYDILIYISVVALMVLIDIALVYALCGNNSIDANEK